MKRNVKKMLAIIMALVVSLSGLSGVSLNVMADDTTIKYSGVDGDLSWSIDSTGLLLVEGSGDYVDTPDWLTYKTSIKKAKIIVDNITSMYKFFYDCSYLGSVDFSESDTSKVTDMSYMFYKCTALYVLDLNNIDTSNVTNMKAMFSQCQMLITLAVDEWDTSKVTNMREMFICCYRLKNIDVSNWNTAYVTTMQSMFHFCYVLPKLDLSNWDTSNVTNMSMMFVGCEKLNSIDVSGWNTARVTNVQEMFKACYLLIDLDLSSFDLTSVTRAGSMLGACTNLIRIKTPKTNSRTIGLPDGNSSRVWMDDEGTIYEDLPETTGTSVTLEYVCVEELRVMQMPRKTKYYIQDVPDLTGLIIEADYSNGITKEVPLENIKISSYDFSVNGTITVKYLGETASFGVEVVQVKVSGYSLSLTGNIAVNVHVELTEEVLNDSTAHMNFTYADGSVSKVYVSDSEEKVVDGVTYYVFACEVQAPEMNDTFTIHMIAESGSTEKYTYSVKEYADYILAHTEGNEEYVKAAPMVRAMLNYGGYSQLQFKHNTDALANDGLYTTDEDPVLTEEVTIDDNYTFTAPSEDIGLRYYGSSLLLDAETTIRHYFTITSEEDHAEICEKYSFVLDDVTVLTPSMRGGMIYIDIKGINAAELDDMFNLVVKNTATEATISVTYSPFSYAKYVLENAIAGTNLVNVIKAMCLYNEAANNYYVVNPHDAIKYNESYVSYDSFDDDNKEDNRIQELCFEDNTLCVSWTSWWSETPGTAGTQTISYKGRTYYGGDGGGEPYSCRFTDNEIIISDYEGNSVYFTLVVQQNGELRVISSNLDEYRVGSVFVLQK